MIRQNKIHSLPPRPTSRLDFNTVEEFPSLQPPSVLKAGSQNSNDGQFSIIKQSLKKGVCLMKNNKQTKGKRNNRMKRLRTQKQNDNEIGGIRISNEKKQKKVPKKMFKKKQIINNKSYDTKYPDEQSPKKTYPVEYIQMPYYNIGKQALIPYSFDILKRKIASKVTFPLQNVKI